MDTLKETRIDGERVYEGELLKIDRDQVRLPDGGLAHREVVRHPGAVVIVAQLPNGKLVFERQFRYPLDRVMLELPAGKCHAGEAALLTAQRELQEETGYQAEEWFYLGVFHPCIGYSDEHIEMFFARGLRPVGQSLDEGEFLEVLEMDPNDAYSAVLDGRITDGKTISTLFWAERVLDGRLSLNAAAAAAKGPPDVG